MAKKAITQATYAVNNIQSQPDQVVSQAAALKLAFDQSVIDAKAYNNTVLITDLADETLNNSGSNTIGHNSTSITADNVGDALEENRQAIATVVLGQIPDGSLTDVKLSNAPGNIKSAVYDSQAIDLVEANGYIKDIIPFEQSEDTGITLTGGAYGTTGVKIGADSYGSDNVGANKVFTASFTAKDLSVLNNGLTSSDEDFITLPVTITGTLPTSVRMELATNVGAIDVNDYNQDLTPALNFQILEYKKSLFTVTGTPNWNSIGYIKITCVGGDATTDVWFDKMQLVATDTSLTYPNPLASQGWSINFGKWFLGKEYNQIILRDLEGVSASNALVNDKLFSDFTIASNNISLSATRADGVMWYVDSNNSISVFARDGKFRLAIRESGVTTNYEKDYTISIGMSLYFELRKSGSNITAKLNNEVINETTTLTSDGVLSLNLNGSSYTSTVLSASITQLPHSNTCNLSEQAKSVQGSVFLDNTLTVANWVDDTGTSGFWIYTIDLPITARDVPTFAVDKTQKKDGKADTLTNDIESFNGYVEIYALTQPSDDLTVDIGVVK